MGHKRAPRMKYIKHRGVEVLVPRFCDFRRTIKRIEEEHQEICRDKFNAFKRSFEDVIDKLWPWM